MFLSPVHFQKLMLLSNTEKTSQHQETIPSSQSNWENDTKNDPCAFLVAEESDPTSPADKIGWDY